MIAPNRDVGNTSSTSAISYTTMQMTSLPTNVVMDINNIAIDNYNDIRERSPTPSKANSRSVSISLSISLEEYYHKMKCLNDLSDEEFREPIDSSQLFYKD